MLVCLALLSVVAVGCGDDGDSTSTDAASTEAPETWAIYLAKWVRWNHLRTLMGTLAALCFAVAASGLRTFPP